MLKPKPIDFGRILDVLKGGDLKVDTNQVISCARNLSIINKQIRNDFLSVQTAFYNLDSTWDGNVSNNAKNKFNSIKNSYGDARYDVVDNFVSFLFQQVGEGYEDTEKTNKSLADAFK